jgi:7-cyano-7-deazaguanine synthase in queuosine biosynthesis
MSKRTTLLMLSGGLDSTSCLFRLLTETDDDVHTYYVKLENNSEKAWCEKESLARIMPIAKNIRDFEHHDATEFYVRGSANGIQPFLWMTASIFMANEIKGDRKRICIGYTAGDCAASRIDEIQDQWKQLWKWSGTERRKPPLYLPLLKRTKAQSMDYLRRLEHEKGIQIVENLWTCEGVKRVHGPNFSGYKACGICDPCKRGLEIGLVQP